MPQEIQQKPWEIQYTKPPVATGGKPWEKAWGTDKAAKPTQEKPQWSEFAKPGPYKTALSEDEEKSFQKWTKDRKVPWQDSPTSDYDMRGYWKAKGHTTIDPEDKKPHYPDTWKTPYHKTFSKESQYALPTAGHWEGEKFVPPTKPSSTAAAPKVEQPSKAEKDPIVQYMKGLQQSKVRWDTPEAILQDPHWYGRSARYLGGELIGVGKAAAGAVGGGVKLLHDVASSINPEEQESLISGTGGKQVAKDVVDIGKGFVDVGKAAWDIIRHFPESSSDPEHFGQTISNAAMIVDGAVKGAKSVAETLKLDPAEAMRVAHRAMNHPVIRSPFKKRAFEDAYVHAKGIDIARKFNKATREIDAEVKTHASNLASKIDKAIPSGVIDAAAEAKKISDTFEDVVKTPDKYHPAIAQMARDAKATAPGLWSFEKARQFRSSIGRAMGKVAGPQKVVLTQLYKDLTNKLRSTSKRYGMEKSWDHYNELERKTSQEFSDALDSIKESKSGKEVAVHLGHDTALTSELTRNLKKYGLDYNEVMKFIKDSTRIAKDRGGWHGSLFRMAYGTPTGIPVMIGARAAGAGWLPGVAAGALSGAGFTYLINLIRALKLSPEVIDHIMSQRELPGRMPTEAGTFPTEEGPSEAPQLTPGPAPVPTPGVPPAPSPTPKPTPPPGGLKGGINVRGVEASTAKRSPAEDVQSHTAEIDRLKKIEENPKATAEEKSSAKNQRETHEELRAKKIPEGQHGKGQLAEQARARERITKNREKAKRGAEAEATEAKARAEAQGIDVSKLQIPEMEEALRGMEPVAWSALQKGRKAKLFPEQDYEPYLREMLLRAYEKGNKAAD